MRAFYLASLTRFFRISLCLVVTAGLIACASTIRQQKEGQLLVLEETLAKSRQTLSELRAGVLPPHFDVHLYLGNDVINKVLLALDDYYFSLPGDPSINIKIAGIRIGNYGSFPTISVSATAQRNELSAELDLAAVLLPSGDPGVFKLKVLTFVPKLSWYSYELSKSNFVQALLSVELEKITDKLPMIRFPVAQAIQLGGPAFSNLINFPTGSRSSLDMSVTVPSTLKNREIIITHYVFLESGVHMFGVIK